MAEGKWIQGLKATMPVESAAGRVLEVRLKVVRDALKNALREPHQDAETIHQLRVSTRRAAAALKIFADVLPSKVHKAAKKKLRKIRRAAGQARDWDVFLLQLPRIKRRHNGVRPGLDFLKGYASAARITALQNLAAVCTDFPSDFNKLLAQTVDAVKKPKTEGPTLSEHSRSLLCDLVEELAAAASKDLQDYPNLHQVRIVGKRLRYTMEICADCFPPLFRKKLYPAVTEMQEILGQANDCFVAAQRLRCLLARLPNILGREWKTIQPGLEACLRFHEARLPRERNHFLKWWQQWTKAGLRSAFLELLEKPTVVRGPLSVASRKHRIIAHQHGTTNN